MKICTLKHAYFVKPFIKFILQALSGVSYIVIGGIYVCVLIL